MLCAPLVLFMPGCYRYEPSLCLFLFQANAFPRDGCSCDAAHTLRNYLERSGHEDLTQRHHWHVHAIQARWRPDAPRVATDRPHRARSDPAPLVLAALHTHHKHSQPYLTPQTHSRHVQSASALCCDTGVLRCVLRRAQGVQVPPLRLSREELEARSPRDVALYRAARAQFEQRVRLAEQSVGTRFYTCKNRTRLWVPAGDSGN